MTQINQHGRDYLHAVGAALTGIGFALVLGASDAVDAVLHRRRGDEDEAAGEGTASYRGEQVPSRSDYIPYDTERVASRTGTASR